ncbi:MAG: glycerophosphodiester phosphodiesterase family protein [Elusimicrobia bacterium]|nr:glycerophosphodiester phosphodiesterase family protein [Elusimicrobiota bacterium]
MAKPLVLAHRGALLNAPENTAAAFKLAFSNGASAVECDIRRTSDGQFIAFHDGDARRVCGKSWRIAGTSYSHLKTLKVFGKEPIAHLDDILNMMILGPARVFYFELGMDSTEDAATLALEIKKAGVQNRAFILTFSHRARLLKAAGAAVPGIGIAVMPFLPGAVLKTAADAGASKVCAGWVNWPLARQVFKGYAALCNFKEQVLAAAVAGVGVSAGVANSYYDIRDLAELGVEGVWTDDVPLAVKTLYGG